MKNTGFLYFRNIVIMALSFFTTRIVLLKLGVSDYGVINLVSGFVSAFTVLDSILASGTRRFLAISIGKGDQDLIKRTFSTALVTHLSISLLVLVALETVGLWFLNSKLNIDPNRMFAANWVFQFAVISTVLGVTQTPYMAAVTAHERFNMYSYMSIFDAITKLLILYLLVSIPGDKLIIYSALKLTIGIISLIIYRIYCIRKFEECAWSMRIDRPLLREMLHFSGWTTLGHLTVVVNGQGTNILFNLFFNTLMNAALGLANTVSFTIHQFIGGFLQASNPQLVKYFGAGDMKRFFKLIFDMTQYTLFLVAIIGVPVLLELDYVLVLWLGKVPEFTAAFVKIGIVLSILNYSNQMVDSGIVATGKVRDLNVFSIPVYLFSLPIVYVVLKFWASPVYAYLFSSIPPLISFIINLYLLRKYTAFPSYKYFFKVFVKNAFLIFLAYSISYIVQYNMEPGIIRFLIVCSISVVSTIVIMYHFSLNTDIKQLVKSKVLTLLQFHK